MRWTPPLPLHVALLAAVAAYDVTVESYYYAIHLYTINELTASSTDVKRRSNAATTASAQTGSAKGATFAEEASAEGAIVAE